ncbi:MAG: PEP-CTERM system TPR-repeat protein PrsT [Colwellia sp.]|nr:PEP-CTERM system TPR-repeat protein PrsT [Colwellia sp.]
MRLLIFSFFIITSFTAFAANNYEKALTAYDKQLIDDAYIHLKNVLQDEPDNLAAKVLMGKVLMQKQYFRDGIIMLNEALNEGADINLFLNELGHAMMIARNFEQVIELVRDKSLNQENQLSWYLLLANAYNSLQAPENARTYFKLALALEPDSDRALGSFAAFELNQKNYDAAEKLINHAIAIYPQQSRIWHLKGQLYQSKKDYNQALVAYKNAYDVNKYDPIVQRALAHAYTYAGKFSQALALVDEILINTPEDAMAKLLQSQLLVSMSKPEEAKAVLVDISHKLSLYSAEQKNNHHSLAYIAGTAAYLQNDFELAQKELLLYLLNVPQDLAAINMLVDIYLRQNQQEKVLDLLESKETLITTNLPLATKLIGLYLNSRKIYKAERLLVTLEEQYGRVLELILAKVNYLTKIERYSDAIALMDKHEPSEFSPTFLLTKGLVFRADRKFVEANEIAETLLKQYPKNSDYLAFKGILFLQQQQWKAAIITFDKVLVNKPEDFNSLFNIATAKAALGQFDEAKVIASALLKTQSEYIPLRILNAKLDRDTHNSSQAIEALISITRANSTNIAASETLIDIYIQKGDFEAALIESDRLTKLVSLNPKYIRQKIEIYLALKKVKQAKKQMGLLKGIVQGPTALYELSQLYIRASDILAGQRELKRALALAPNNLRFKLELIKIDIQLNEYQLANVNLTAIEKTNQNNPNVLLVRGDFLVKQNKLQLANVKYTKALTLDNNFTQALAKLYQMALEGIGDKEFIKTTTAILKKHQSNHLMRKLLADHFLNTGDLVRAQYHYEILKDVKELPNKSLIFNNLANLVLKKDLGLAEGYILRAIEINDSSATLLDTYGWIKSLQGHFEEGLTILRRAYAMNANDPAINYHLGYTLFKLQRHQEAKKELALALSSDINFYEQKEAQLLLNSL